MPGDVETSRPFQVFSYSFARLAELFAEVSKTNKDRVEAKQQFDYFRDYFEHFKKAGPLTIVVEWKYTDRDFLEDFAAYYVRCFQQKYSSICARLHFFRIDFDERSLRAAIDGLDLPLLAELQNCDRYLGFIVAKPLPSTFIGRTCLGTYAQESPQRRFFPVVRRYDVHFLGLDLAVRSLAYQEQDTVAAACATSALWSAFQGTARLFQHEIRSPVEITRIATEQTPSFQRDVPNHGLTPPQMAVAIKTTGLEPEVIGVASSATLQATAYAYLRVGIPLVMNTALYDVSDPENPKPYRDVWGSGHAVAVTGYSLGESEPAPYPNTETLLRSSRIDKLYVHDDQIGPFARVEFGTPGIEVTSGGRSETVTLTLRSSWRGGDEGQAEPGTVWFGPKALIVPLYHKIRIRFDSILHWVLDNDERYRAAEKPSRLPASLEWDIYLTTEDVVKSDVRKATSLSPGKRWRLLEQPLPRFLWRATALSEGSRVYDFLFDATDIDQGDFVIDQLIYDL